MIILFGKQEVLLIGKTDQPSDYHEQNVCQEKVLLTKPMTRIGYADHRRPTYYMPDMLMLAFYGQHNLFLS